jgi:hypothetical protein
MVARGELPRDELWRDELPRDELWRGELPRDELWRGELPRDELWRDELQRDELPHPARGVPEWRPLRASGRGHPFATLPEPPAQGGR